MKKIIILILFVFASCSNEKYKIITSKNYTTYTGGDLPNGICRYTYKNSMADYREFQERCDAYSLGDTIHGLTINQ